MPLLSVPIFLFHKWEIKVLIRVCTDCWMLSYMLFFFSTLQSALHYLWINKLTPSAVFYFILPRTLPDLTVLLKPSSHHPCTLKSFGDSRHPSVTSTLHYYLPYHTILEEGFQSFQITCLLPNNYSSPPKISINVFIYPWYVTFTYGNAVVNFAF